MGDSERGYVVILGQILREGQDMVVILGQIPYNKHLASSRDLA